MAHGVLLSVMKIDIYLNFSCQTIELLSTSSAHFARPSITLTPETITIIYLTEKTLFSFVCLCDNIFKCLSSFTREVHVAGD